MEFGGLPLQKLDHIDLTLPPDHGSNKDILTGKPHLSPKVFIGCAKW